MENHVGQILKPNRSEAGTQSKHELIHIIARVCPFKCPDTSCKVAQKFRKSPHQCGLFSQRVNYSAFSGPFQRGSRFEKFRERFLKGIILEQCTQSILNTAIPLEKGSHQAYQQA